MAITDTQSPCTDLGQHLLGQVLETLADGRQRKACIGGCDSSYVVEPDAQRIYADYIPAHKPVAAAVPA